MSNLFDAQTKDQIESRMVQTLHTLTETDKTAIEGSFTRDMIDTNAVEFENSYAEMAMLRDAAFAETAWGDYLTLRAEEFGIQRKQAVKANGQVTVTGQSGAYIIRGSLFQTKDGLRFYTTESATIPSDGTEADIAVQAADTGVKGNVAPGTITEIPYSIPNVYSVINPEKCTDGADEETDAALLARLLFRVRQPITSGNANHYRSWAMSVDGVGNCKVIPLWNGNGTVKVIIVTAENESASKELIQKVSRYIESHRGYRDCGISGTRIRGYYGRSVRHRQCGCGDGRCVCLFQEYRFQPVLCQPGPDWPAHPECGWDYRLSEPETRRQGGEHPPDQ